MDLQLNLTTNTKVNKANKNVTQKTPRDGTTINFVKKPVLKGTTFARRRKQVPNKGQTNTFLLSSEKSAEVKKNVKTIPKLKSKEENATVLSKSGDESELDLNLQFDEIKKDHTQKIKRKFDKNTSQSKNIRSHKNANKNSNADNSEETSEKDKLPTFKQISSLFKNNPEIPTVGQRHVKPVNEKLFSGKNFVDLNIHSFSISNLEKNMGLKELTVVQQKSIPVILQGRDTLVRSQTGSGKTLAYALPIVEAMQAIRPKLTRQDGIRALIIVPTRELALQTYELFVKLVYPFMRIVPGYLIGGEKRKSEKARIKKGINILIGTPGRVCDHLQHTNSFKLDRVRCLILDEADRLLDMGYEKDVSSIVQALEHHKEAATYDPMAMIKQASSKSHIHFDEVKSQELKKEVETDEKVEHYHEMSNTLGSDKRQTVLLSATLTKAVETLAGLTMENPVFIDSSEDRGTLIADSITKPKTDSSAINLHQESIDDIEIVPQGDTEDDHDSDSTSNKSKSGNDEDTDNSDDAKKAAPTFKGLKMFSGILNTNKVKTEKKKSKKLKKKKIESTNLRKGDSSDSDSDYDFFSAVKKDTNTTVVTDSGSYDNPFQNAVKTALAQDEMVIPASVTQTYIVVPMKLRLVTLSALIVQKCVTPGCGKMLVFMATQDMIDYHCELLSRTLTGKKPKELLAPQDKRKNKPQPTEDTDEQSVVQHEENDNYEYNYDGIPLEEYEEKLRAAEAFVDVEFFQLHGSMDQRTRTEVFKTFRKANSGVLLCTDVAARGLDLPKVDCIVQFTGPISATDYVHRVGRTARAGNVGTAIMLLLPSEIAFVGQLEERRIRLHQEDMESTLASLQRKNVDYKRRHDADQVAAAALQQTCEELVEADRGLFLKACKAFTSWMRFYSTYPREARAAFDRKALHVGHAARALALRVAPRQIAKATPNDRPERPNNRLTNQTEERRRERAQNKKTKESIPAGFDVKPTSVKAAKRDRLMMVSEFESGLEPKKKKKVK